MGGRVWPFRNSEEERLPEGLLVPPYPSHQVAPAGLGFVG